MDKLLRFGQYAGAILALVGIIALWTKIGLPVPAWKGDVARVEGRALDTAIEVYSQKQQSLILQKVEIERAGATDTRGYGYVAVALEETSQKLEELRQEKIGLSQ